MTRLAVNPDVSTALFDNAVNRGEAEPGSFFFLFRGEEGVEDSRLRFFVHTHPGIADGQHYVISRQHPDVLARVFLVEFDTRGFDG